MTITKSRVTGYLLDSMYNKLKTVVGSTYSSSGLTSKTITYIQGFPRDYTAYRNTLPVICFDEPTRLDPQGFMQGGDRKYTFRTDVHVIAGGYTLDSQNDLMKHDIMDLILFGFDQKVYDLINPYSGSVEGRYNSEVREVPRMILDNRDDFQRSHGVLSIVSWVTIYNN